MAKDISETIREVREKRGMTQRQLADMSGVSRNTVINWEGKKRTPDADDIRRLALALNTTAAYLMGETDDPTPKSPPQTEIRDTFICDVHDVEIHDFITRIIRLPVFSKATIACAGFGNGGMDGIVEEVTEFLEMPADVVGGISADKDKFPFVVSVEGDSMKDAGIPDGCQIVVNPLEPVYDGDPALVRFGIQNELAVKWVFWHKDRSVEIRSASLLYPPKTFDREDIELGLSHVVGKVMKILNDPKRGI